MTRSILFDDMASESHENADMLSLGDSESEKYSDIEELFGNKITTRSSAVCNTDEKKPVRGMKRKTQTPGFHDKTQAKAKKPRKQCTEPSPQTEHNINFNELKNQLGIDKIVESISMLTHNQMAESTERSSRHYDNKHESTEHAMGNNKQVPSSTITQGDLCNKNHKSVKQFVSIPEYDQSNEMNDDANDFDFDISYLDNQVSSPSIIGVNPNEAFKDVSVMKTLKLLLIMI